MMDDEKLFAWLDGELGPAEAAEVEAKVAADPGLQRLAKQHRALGSQLHSVFNEVADAPVPDRLKAALRPTAQVIDFSAARQARSYPSLSQWGAIAATLAVGISIGTMVPQASTAPVQVKGGAIYAAAGLNRALDTQLGSTPDGDLRIGLTFRNHAGQICRSFTQQASSGLACRSGGLWQMKGLFAAPEGQSTDYRMAGTDPNLATLVDSTMLGEPLNAAQENAAEKNGWR